MNPQVAPLFEILRLNTRLYLNVLDGVDDDAAQVRPCASANSLLFIALHVLDGRCFAARMLGADATHPYQEELDAVQSIEEMERFPELDGVRAAWREASEILEERLPELTAAELAEKAPTEFPVGDGTVLGGAAFLGQHESYHIGQLAYVRRCLGLEGMSYW